MKIIGHRGAAGLALENTMNSFQKAIEVGAEIIEFDVRATADGQLAISHGDDLARLGGGNHNISDLTTPELHNITLKDGSHIPLLEDVLELVAGRIPVMIEIKTIGGTEQVLAIMEKFPDQPFFIASPRHDEIKRLKQLRPDIKGYPRAICNPFLAIYRTKRYGADGIDLYDWWLPIIYFPCRLLGLEVIVFTVNHRWIGKLIGKLFPKVMLCTNYPNLFTQP